jgi:hypothetical protein
MKYFFAIIFALFSHFCFSQEAPSYYNCYKSVKGIWNDYKKEWDYDEPKSSNIEFKIYKNIITANDEAQSRYATYGDKRETEKADYKQASWDAVDEKSRRVTFSVVNYKSSGDLVFMVFYDDTVFVYFVNKSGLSPFN